MVKREPQTTLNPVYKTEHYTITPDSVRQENYIAQALSATEIISNYESLTHKYLAPHIFFKFSLNGHDNEMEYGQNHSIYCTGMGIACETPLIKFGHQFTDHQPLPDNVFLAPNTPFKIRLDLREVLAAFNNQGFYTTYHNQQIQATDFKGVFVAGSAAPLTWNFADLALRPDLELKDITGTGIYEITLILNPHRPNENDPWSRWRLSKDICNYPGYQSGLPLADALYNLSLEELVQAIEPDNTFRTGKEWAGVWTRDISYSIILALAAVAPAVSQNSLLKKVKRGRIVQDTGTGGAYPISTDRQIWAVAAWEIFVVTGDRDWLCQAYSIIRQSLEDDYLNVYDHQTGLVCGESSFLDWREQTYPAWMQAADIFESECLGTNAVHYQANSVLSQMAQILNEPTAAAKYAQIAQNIKAGINKYLWQPEAGYYGQYRYGRHYKILSPRADALGEALCVLFGIADAEQRQRIVLHTPVGHYGISCIFPQIPQILPYHNKAVWPFVQGYWTWAAAISTNQAALTAAISAQYRAAALFLTNKENFVAATGDYGGTQVNSDNMLWSLAGSLSLVYKIFFGLHFTPAGLIFQPYVPPAFARAHCLTDFKYRQANLHIYLEGKGSRIESFTLNGQAFPDAIVPPDLIGPQEIKIKLADEPEAVDSFTQVDECITPQTPTVNLTESGIHWAPVDHAVSYQVLKNGQPLGYTTATYFNFKAAQNYAQYQVIAIDAAGQESFASEPVIITSTNTLVYKIGEVNAQGYIEINRQQNTVLLVHAAIPETGTYAIDVKYANGNGPIETDNKCAFRALRKGDKLIGTLVMPQRGADNWDDWGYSNAVITYLEKGNTLFSVAYLPHTQNMHGEINQAWLDHIRFIKID